MIVSWNWLGEYVKLDVSVEQLADRLTMAGLNLEECREVDGDVAIDLEVTSNRPDCLGHVGVAREASVLLGGKLWIPPAAVKASGEKTSQITSVEIQSPDLCRQYFARVVRGVRVAPSPAWLQKRLNTLGIAPINNIVDITNYVLMECGQPLHAFDFKKLRGGRIVVRNAKAGERLVAINQREYLLNPDMCVIADAERPVAIGGVMGGLETEISDATTDVLIETAEFAPMAIRSAARALNLHSDSSYRFERGVDPTQLDWASRRCCELILDLAGGELLDEPVIAGKPPERRAEPIRLRFAQIPRILGIDVPRKESIDILESLGLQQQQAASESESHFMPPSWRRDLTRENDLIEEVARIHGYEHIPDNAPVSIAAVLKTERERVLITTRDVMVAAGFCEAITFSFVSDELVELFRPRGPVPTLQVEHSSRKRENILRQSIIPNLLQSRRENERHGTFDADLFEIARVYLAAEPSRPESEPTMLGCVAGRPYSAFKGVLETLVARINPEVRLEARPSSLIEFTPGRGAELLVNDIRLGWLGELSREVTDRLDLRDAVTTCELDISVLESIAVATRIYSEIPTYPGIVRDLNFVLDLSVRWDELAAAVREAAGPLLASLSFGGEYRGQQIPPDKKSYLLSLDYRSPDRTLTHDDVEPAQARVIEACKTKLGAELR